MGSSEGAGVGVAAAPLALLSGVPEAAPEVSPLTAELWELLGVPPPWAGWEEQPRTTKKITTASTTITSRSRMGRMGGCFFRRRLLGTDRRT